MHTYTSSHTTCKQQEWTSIYRHDIHPLQDVGCPCEVREVMEEGETLALPVLCYFFQNRRRLQNEDVK